uniref:Centriolar coiled-coil protein of 110 kDa-like n=1 Tax=Lepisosteus oculatus TaxID=7918 RepID=W5N4C0_LEPOC|nr:PREDICTED: centriolar coiled-coil protein of 110 kDa-like isoform X1 [Lepisosteus oculatus]XP_015212269.1 PREDICTED: centriolar coiled-coil protein of 110 kDa-like isoform X1 [Lepisosteus oculatus]XP_015212270.1 PREDICTED: centriolar coiled-coil protein of 110 kDa-like isoform X1 [Lepisosteus oculatus]XP_015212271.1 PREDICTED: centriolar coiled-coil protein of 110 kDa-like isoform X1 [Lepisosteus oculatus]
MESYEEFFQTQLSLVKERALSTTDKNADPELDSRRSSSCIRFHGIAILPPVFTRERRAEMWKYKDEAVNFMNQKRKLPKDPRMFRVQALLDSVQLRRAPTLEEFVRDDSEPLLRESSKLQEAAVKSMDVESETDRNDHIDPLLSLNLPAKPDHNENMDIGFPKLTSSVDSFCATDSPDVQNTYTVPVTDEGSVIDCHQSDTVQSSETKSTIASDTQVLQNPKTHNNVSQRSMSSGYLTCDNTDLTFHTNSGAENGCFSTDGHTVTQGFFLHENAGLTSNVSDIVGDTVADFSSKDICEGSKTAGQDVVSEDSDLKTVGYEKPCYPEHPVEPYRMSLQNLLKKSQEYRNKQRQLKNSKARALENSKVDSLSDKENDTSPQILRGESGKTKEKKSSCGRVRFLVSEGALTGGMVSSISSVNSGTRILLADKKLNRPGILERSKMGFDQEKKEHAKQRSGIEASSVSFTPCKPIVVDKSFASNEPEVLSYTTKQNKAADLPYDVSRSLTPQASFIDVKKPDCIPSQSTVDKKFRTVPCPQLCKSPVHSQKVSGPSRKLLVNTSLSVGNEIEGEQISNKANCSYMDDQIRNSRNQTVQITQLEMNLSSLKSLILDLESTITEVPTKYASEESMVENTESSVKNVENVAFQLKKMQPDHRKVLEDWKQMSATSLAQKSGVPDMSKSHLVSNVGPQKGRVLADLSSRAVADSVRPRETESTWCCHSVNQSYDVEMPSGLWLQGRESGQEKETWGKVLTPVSEGNGQESRAKRRLLMNTPDLNIRTGQAATETRIGEKLMSSTPNVKRSLMEKQQLQLRQAHAMQVRTLVEEQQKEQQHMLQKIATQYQLLQHISAMSPNCSRYWRDMTFPSTPLLEQPVSPPVAVQAHGAHSVTPLSLITAVIKGYLTRRLLRTERVAQLVRTIKDTRHFLLTLQPHTPGRAEFSSKQDQALRERVQHQLRSAHYEVHDIFFGLSPEERMQIISWDRDLVRNREIKQKNGTKHSRGKGSLSAATKKSLERKRSLLLWKRVAERQRGPGNVYPGRQLRQHSSKENSSALSTKHR